MYVVGNVIAIDKNLPRVKLQIPDLDDFETGWFFVPQMTTVKDKSFNQIALKTLVGACCTDDLQDGCVIGALYNDEDVCILGDENVKYVFFEDGAKLKYDKTTHELTIIAQTTTMQTDLNVVGNINCTQNITSLQNVSDAIGSMALIRTKHNAHVHGNGNGGYNTTTPMESM